jgi:hypothetical protein
MDIGNFMGYVHKGNPFSELLGLARRSRVNSFTGKPDSRNPATCRVLLTLLDTDPAKRRLVLQSSPVLPVSYGKVAKFQQELQDL